MVRTRVLSSQVWAEKERGRGGGGGRGRDFLLAGMDSIRCNWGLAEISVGWGKEVLLVARRKEV